jgi:hypothetical protein
MTTPIGQAPTPENSAKAVAAARQMATPNGTAQEIGKGVGNAAQFFIPGAAEERAASALAPMIGKLDSKIAASAVGSAIVNKAEGGSAGAGAAMGAAGPLLGAGLKTVAPELAETAMGTRAADRAGGRTAGQTILSETTGVNPGDIAEQAATKSRGYMDGVNKAALGSDIPVNLDTSRDVAQSFLNTATKQNKASTIKEVGQIGQQLATRPNIGAIPASVPADEALPLRQGIDTLHGSWNPANARPLSDSAINATRAALNDELGLSIPDYKDSMAKISNLIPVANRAGAMDLNAGVLQRVIGKAARPTGALVGSIAGGTAGYKADGVRGAILGGGLGLVAPEIATSPTTLMMGARALDSSLIPKYAIPAATGLGLQLGKPKN